MTRSIWKGPFFVPLITKNETDQISIYCRGSTIMPKEVSKKIRIYNGKKFLLRVVENEMIGHKYGEFANTRAKYVHKKKKSKKKR